MNMNFFVPTRIITGKDCIKQNSDVFSSFGKSCLIVTGKTAAKKCGALSDVTSILSDLNIKYEIFDGIEQNPSYSSCLKASALAKSFNAEFVIGIGGGSPLDASKAIAVLTACNDVSPEKIYNMEWDASPLPVIAIGTTSGTGSEVTPVSVITTPEGLKKSLRADSIYPKVSFGDATYTMSLSAEFTRSTALDALSHSVESYFNRATNEICRTFAVRGIEILLEMLEKTADYDTSELSFNDREKLYFASLYGGLAISVSGTTFPHGMGYFLSEQKNIPHGNACAVYLEEFINYNENVVPEETADFFKKIGTDKETLINLIKKNLPDLGIKLTKEEIENLAPRFENNKNLKKCYGNADKEFAVNLLKKLF